MDTSILTEYSRVLLADLFEVFVGTKRTSNLIKEEFKIQNDEEATSVLSPFVLQVYMIKKHRLECF